jgi:hypothetical protein
MPRSGSTARALNGYQCLPLLRVVSRQRLSGERVPLHQSSSGARTARLLCSAPAAAPARQDMPPVSQFDFHVTFKDGDYFVQDEPVFVPCIFTC